MASQDLKFTAFGFHKNIQEMLDQQRYKVPTPVQREAIPLLMQGRDVIGCAQTGTGKTAAFALPVLNSMAEFMPAPVPFKPRALVLVPTRELAKQVGDSFRTYGRKLNVKVAITYGGVKHSRQVQMLKSGTHVLVATPGRFLDLHQQDAVKLDLVRYFVLDEADRMLDMGFMPDIEKVLKELPAQRQTALFSATMPPQIAFLAKEMMKNPAEVKVSDGSLIAKNIDQRVMYLENAKKPDLLIELLQGNKMKKVIIFGRTKLAVERVAGQLQEAGIKVGVIHGDKFQRERQKTVQAFEAGEVDILFATDVASRGLDIEGVSHVINYNVPEDPEDYVHRVGRTARAGKRGVAITLCGRSERKLLSNIERYVSLRISVVRSHPFHSFEIEKMNLHKPAKEKNQRSASGAKKHRKTHKDRRSAAAKLKNEPAAAKKHRKAKDEEKVSLAQAKKNRKKAKAVSKKESAILKRIKKHYR